jgi:carboxyl-terminal processing protease
MKTRNLIIGCFLAAGLSRVAAAPSVPSFQEVYQILSTNLEGVNSNELDQAAVLGLIHQLEPRVSLAVGEAGSAKAAPLAEARVFDESLAYVRVGAVTSHLAEDFRAAYHQMTETNQGKIKGLVLDLRFASGSDYAAAAKLADCFLSSEHPLLDWQTGSAHATLKTNAITIPAAILVNAQTVGAAEALAAVLRDTEVGLILGSQTPGQASVFKEFPLSNGSKLRVAVAAVSFGAGKTLPQGVTPDIALNTSLEDERAYLQDPYKILHPPEVAKTDAAAKEAPEEPRLNEVGLIRRHKNGDDADEAPARDTPDVPDAAPTVADPALGRALDLLKGLAVVQPNRPG